MRRLVASKQCKCILQSGLESADAFQSGVLPERTRPFVIANAISITRQFMFMGAFHEWTQFHEWLVLYTT